MAGWERGSRVLHALCVQVAPRRARERCVSMPDRLSHVGSMREAIPRQVRRLPLPSSSSSLVFFFFFFISSCRFQASEH